MVNIKTKWFLCHGRFLIALGQLKEARTFAVFQSIDVHRHIHHLVNRTVEVKGPSSAKKADLRTIIAIEDLIHARCPGFYRWFCHATHPTAIFDLMRRNGIIYQIEHLPFMKGDRILDETQSPHMYRWDNSRSGLFNAT